MWSFPLCGIQTCERGAIIPKLKLGPLLTGCMSLFRHMEQTGKISEYDSSGAGRMGEVEHRFCMTVGVIDHIPDLFLSSLAPQLTDPRGERILFHGSGSFREFFCAHFS